MDIFLLWADIIECYSISCHIQSYHSLNANPNMNPKTNVTTVKWLCANEIIATHHVRHIFMPIDQTIKKLFIFSNIFLNVTFQSHSTHHGCCKQKRTCLIVATINPIPHRPCVHVGTFFKVLIY